VDGCAALTVVDAGRFPSGRSRCRLRRPRDVSTPPAPTA